VDSALHANLARLRHGKGWSQEAAADHAGLSRVGYANLEAGRSQPKSENLYALARAFGVPVESLLTPPVLLKHVRFRSTRQLKLREEIIVRTGRWLEDYAELEELLDARSAARLPTERFGRGEEGAIRAAAAAREELDIGKTEGVRNLAGLLEERAGIKLRLVSHASHDFFGLSISAQDRGPAIVVNAWDRISVERWIFSCAHELGHLILHLGAYDIDEKAEDEAQEKEANLFASHFLMPSELFLHEWSQTRGLGLVERVIHAKRLFHVSYKTVLMRLTEIGEPDIWRRFQGLWHRRTGRGLTKTEEPAPSGSGAFAAVLSAEEPFHLLASDLLVTRLSSLTRKALEQGLISMTRAAEILEKTTPQMRELVQAWAD
jgi:Zn-dependent peptidase ImmA (M78 family)/DNA-binding XRE family transcriptional regulator